MKIKLNKKYQNFKKQPAHKCYICFTFDYYNMVGKYVWKNIIYSSYFVELNIIHEALNAVSVKFIYLFIHIE